MARITTIGRANKIVYGTNAVFTFDIDFITPAYSSTGGIGPNWYAPTGSSTLNPAITNDPQPGTLVIAGTTVTLAAADIQTPQLVAKKILSTGISGWTVSLNPYMPDLVTLQSTSVGHVATPSVALGTATGIFFIDVGFTDGQAMPATGAQDDILVRGNQPISLVLSWTGGATPSVQTSTGTDLEQSQGTLTYGASLTFNPSTSGGLSVLTTPVDYVRVTTAAGNTQVVLYVVRN
jgi:hypothetical protein